MFIISNFDRLLAFFLIFMYKIIMLETKNESNAANNFDILSISLSFLIIYLIILMANQKFWDQFSKIVSFMRMRSWVYTNFFIYSTHNLIKTLYKFSIDLCRYSVYSFVEYLILSKILCERTLHAQLICSRQLVKS